MGTIRSPYLRLINAPVSSLILRSNTAPIERRMSEGSTVLERRRYGERIVPIYLFCI